jgi:hypothetical protein
MENGKLKMENGTVKTVSSKRRAKEIVFFGLIIIALCGHAPAAAQFTVPRNAGRGINFRTDTVRTTAVRENKDEAPSPARLRARKLAIRKDRNTTEFTGRLSATQTQFDNWSAGGENTFSALSALFFRHQYKRGGFGFEGRADAQYGMNYIGRQSFKNQDFFQLNTLTTWKAAKFWSWSADGELRSQFAKGYKSRTDKTLISNFMAPGALKLAVGIVYQNSPWTINVSPVGGSATFMWDPELSARGLGGVPKGNRSKWQVGPSLRIIYEQAFARDAIKIRSEAYSFTNIRTAPTFRWETRCDIKATKYLTTTLYNFMQYDKAANTPIPDHLQHQYSIAVGLSYTWKNK